MTTVEFPSEAIDWTDLDLETTLPPAAAVRAGRVVPSDRIIYDRRNNVRVAAPGDLLTIEQALRHGIIAEDEADEWRAKLDHVRMSSLAGYPRDTPGERLAERVMLDALETRARRAAWFRACARRESEQAALARWGEPPA